MHVLLVDPVSISQRMIGKVLRPCCTLTAVDSLHEASINITRSAIDALLITADDEAEEALSYAYLMRQAHSPLVNSPIVLITSRYSEDLAFRAWRSGVTATVAKPLDPEHFRELLSQQVAVHRPVPVERSRCLVQLVGWVKGGLHYRYAPDLDRLVSARTAEEAQAGMRELLDQFRHVFQDSRFGEARVRIAQERLELDAWQPAGEGSEAAGA
ncbi:MAG: hypothetical protein ACOCXJ_00900 [Planctomycetota bacterium]